MRFFLFVCIFQILLFTASAFSYEKPGEIELIQKAAELGVPEGQFLLGKAYYLGNGVDQNKDEAIKWYTLSAKQGDSDAQLQLGLHYILLADVKDFKVGFEWLNKAANQNNKDAQYVMGTIFKEGNNVSQDFTLAAKWFQKAAESGQVFAMKDLGILYFSGSGVPQDNYEAVKWLKIPAEKNDAGAQFLLGLIYMHNLLNYQESLKWLKLSANQGNAGAQRLLGDSYFQGLGVSQDTKEGIKWYLKAAEQGEAESQFVLGLAFMTGNIGILQDYAESAKWFKKAAEQGRADAQYYLSGMYCSGYGVKKDDVECYSWLILAAANGDKNAIKLLDSGVSYVTLLDKERAQKLAKKRSDLIQKKRTSQ